MAEVMRRLKMAIEVCIGCSVVVVLVLVANCSLLYQVCVKGMREEDIKRG